MARYVGYYRNRLNDAGIARFDVINGKLAERLGDTVQTYTYRGNGKFTGDGLPETFMVVFTGADSGAPLRAQFTRADEPYGEPIFRMTEAEVWRPAPSVLAPYEGNWLSKDIEAIWTLRMVAGALRLARRGTTDVTLLPLRRDEFSVQIGGWDGMSANIHFERDANGVITAFVISGESPHQGVVKLVQFERIGR